MGTKARQVRPATDCVSVHLPSGYKDKLTKIAFNEDRAVTRIIKTAIEEYAKRKHNVDLRKLEK